MSSRYVYPSMGAIRRPLSRDVVAVCSRAFHGSARRPEDNPSNASPTPTASTPQREPRKVRNANAANAITSLSNRRPLQRNANVGGGSPPNVPPGAKVIQPRKPLVPRSSTGGAASPSGTMVRAPSKLRITRNAQDSKFRGPNLGARSRGPSSRGPPNRGSEGGPKRRDRKAGGRTPRDEPEPGREPGSELPDGLVQHLLRLQRKEWDRVSYQPKYAPGSFAANELIHTGRELFKGDVPPIKVWGPLEKTLGIVGMHRGEAHLQVRRVLDGDAAPFGKEEENLLEKQSEKKVVDVEAQAVQA